MLERIHRGKTGALFVASAVAGAMTAGRRRRADRRALRVREEPRARVPDHRRPARRRRRSGADRQGGARRTPARRRSCRSAASPARGSSPPELCQTADRALAPFGRRADRLRELSAFVAARNQLTAAMTPLRATTRASTSCGSGCARSATSTPASIGSCSGRRAATRRPSAIALLASLRVGALAALLLGPAAAHRASAPALPGLVTGAARRDRHRDLPRGLLRRRGRGRRASSRASLVAADRAAIAGTSGARRTRGCRERRGGHRYARAAWST